MNPERIVREYIFELLEGVSFAEISELAGEYGVGIGDLDDAFDRVRIAVSFEEKR